MNKQEFFDLLREKLSGLSQDDIEERINFYNELIDDMVEDGVSEADAIASIGSDTDIVKQITGEASFPKNEERATEDKPRNKRRLKGWEILLLAVGSPLWIPLLLSAIVIALSLYISIWAVVVSLWAVFVAFIGVAIGGVVACVALICQGKVLEGLAILGIGLACAGLSILAFFACKAASKGSVALAKIAVRGVKRIFSEREGV